jgi:hypothetical protein
VPADQPLWTAKQDSVSLPGQVGLPGLRHSIGLARWWHLGTDMLWLLNGAVFTCCSSRFKQVKWLAGIEFVAHFSEVGGGYGGYNPDHEFFGYRQSI